MEGTSSTMVTVMVLVAVELSTSVTVTVKSWETCVSHSALSPCSVVLPVSL